jgi:hypothetical protein
VLLSALPALLYVGLVVYSLIDCLQLPPDEVYRFSRGQWVAVILFIPLFGALTWLVAGRPSRGRHGRGRSRTTPAEGYDWVPVARYPVGPDDDPDFLAGLGRAQRERQRLLTRQEEDRRRRENRRRRDQSGGSDDADEAGSDRT